VARIGFVGGVVIILIASVYVGFRNTKRDATPLKRLEYVIKSGA
jgi:hypothetical protein